MEVDSADLIPNDLPMNSAVIVIDLQRLKWIAFDCPCRRGHRVMLNLDSNRKPFWRVPDKNSLTLYPSINDRTVDRACHYFIRKGKIDWVRATIDMDKK